MTDETLADIGLSRAEARAEARRPFWRAAAHDAAPLTLPPRRLTGRKPAASLLPPGPGRRPAGRMITVSHRVRAAILHHAPVARPYAETRPLRIETITLDPRGRTRCW